MDRIKKPSQAMCLRVAYNSDNNSEFDAVNNYFGSAFVAGLRWLARNRKKSFVATQIKSRYCFK